MAAGEGNEGAQFRLFKAIEAGDTEAVKKLLDEDPRLIGAHNKDGASALIIATYYRRREIADLLLANGVKPNVFEAAALGLTDRIEDLLRSDRTLVHRYSHDGWTPLHLAGHFGRLDAIRVLLSSGADHRAVSKNSNRNQPLQAAAAGGQIGAVELLLKAGAQVDHRSHSGITALHIAAQSGNPKMVEMFLKAGADIDATTESGKMAIDFAAESGKADAVALLEKAKGEGKATRSGSAARSR